MGKLFIGATGLCEGRGVPPLPPGFTLDGDAHADYSKLENLCWYTFTDFRRLYPEYNNLNDKALKELLYEKAGQPLKHFHPWQKLGKVIAFAFGAPLAALVLGRALLWGAGFRATE